MMKVLILRGSPRTNGNTNSLTDIFVRRMEELGHRCQNISLYGMDLRPCLACRCCQDDWSKFGCVQDDRMGEIFKAILDSDIIIIASPIYSWYCTPPTKTVLDRMVYGMNKYYGKGKGPALWSGKRLALITTCGYPPENGAGLWEEGIKRYCRHSQLKYCGMLAERHMGYDTIFMDDKKREHAEAFAGSIGGSLEKRGKP